MFISMLRMGMMVNNNNFVGRALRTCGYWCVKCMLSLFWNNTVE